MNKEGVQSRALEVDRGGDLWIFQVSEEGQTTPGLETAFLNTRK